METRTEILDALEALWKAYRAERESLYEGVTGRDGTYEPGPIGEADRREVERMDAILDRAKAALAELRREVA